MPTSPPTEASTDREPVRPPPQCVQPQARPAAVTVVYASPQPHPSPATEIKAPKQHEVCDKTDVTLRSAPKGGLHAAVSPPPVASPKRMVLAPAKTWTERNAWVAFLPALLVYPLWFYTLVNTGSLFQAFSEYWPGTLGMVVGSFIAGSTPLGGGVVAFPLAVLVFKFSSPESRDASVLVQAVGMNSAAFLLFVQKPHLLNSQLICLSCVFSSWGVTWGIAQPMDPFLVNLTYTVFISVFALIYWHSKAAKNEEEAAGDRARDAVSGQAMRALQAVVSNPTFPFSSDDLRVVGPLGRGYARDVVVFVALAAVSVLGGYVTAMVGSGADMALYIFGLFVWNPLSPELHMSDTEFTASSVVVMGAMSAYTALLRVLNGGFTQRVELCWAAMACVVCLGAPLGSTVLKPSAEPFLRALFYMLAFVQFVSFAALKIQGSTTAWVVIAIVFTVEVLVLGYLQRAKRYSAPTGSGLTLETTASQGGAPAHPPSAGSKGVEVVVVGDMLALSTEVRSSPGQYRVSNVVVGTQRRGSSAQAQRRSVLRESQTADVLGHQPRPAERTAGGAVTEAAHAAAGPTLRSLSANDLVELTGVAL